MIAVAGTPGRMAPEVPWPPRRLWTPLRPAFPAPSAVLTPGSFGWSELPIVDEGPLCGVMGRGHGIVHGSACKNEVGSAEDALPQILSWRETLPVPEMLPLREGIRLSCRFSLAHKPRAVSTRWGSPCRRAHTPSRCSASASLLIHYPGFEVLRPLFLDENRRILRIENEYKELWTTGRTRKSWCNAPLASLRRR